MEAPVRDEGKILAWRRWEMMEAIERYYKECVKKRETDLHYDEYWFTDIHGEEKAKIKAAIIKKIEDM